MNKAFIDGFTKKAQDAGLSPRETELFLKQALDMGPAGGPPPGAGGPPPPGAGGPPPGADPGAGPDMSGGMGIPPELEQLIQNLPPEVLEQLVAEIEAEMANDPSGGAGGDPGLDPSAGGGAPPPMDPSMGGGLPPKAGSAKIIAREPKYIEGFVERSLSYGFDKQASKDLYKRALDIMEGQPVQTPVPTGEKRASHFEGFVAQAKAYGISQDEAVRAYQQQFGN